MKTRRVRGWITVAVVAALVVAAWSSAASATAVAPAAEPGIPAIIRKVSPSVVTILTSDGLGSGVVWSRDGTIVTANHVVAGSRQVKIELGSGKEVSGTVLAGDPITDLAVVKADRTGLQPATFAKTLPVVGDLAIAIGSPLGFPNTASAGIISALQRSLPGEPGQTPTLLNLVQTDAAISPGDSGGALVDAQARVIGINEAYIPPTSGAVSIGFATPATTVDKIVAQLLANGKAIHPYFGAQLTDLTPNVARQLGVRASAGLVTLAVVDGRPAANAGIQPGDVIVALGATPVPNTVAFIAALRAHKPGDEVNVKLVRGSSTLVKKATLIEQPV